MYGLKQVARLVYDSLKEHLATNVYYPNKFAQNIWYHKTKRQNFVIVFMISEFSNF